MEEAIMSGLAGNKKRTTRKRSLILIGILVLFVLQAGAEQKGKFLFGVYTGRSFGLGQEFAWQSQGAYKINYDLNLHFGGYVQYNLSEQFGLQLNINYQFGAMPWTFQGWEEPEESGKDKFFFTSFNLNGVFNYVRLKNVRFYLLGGGGINSVYWAHFDGIYFNFAGGTGVKIYFKPDSRSAINIGATFHHLMDRKFFDGISTYHANYANYLRLNIGFEFQARDYNQNNEGR